MALDGYLSAFLATYFVMMAMIYSAKHAAIQRRDGRGVVASSERGSAQHQNHSAFGILRASILVFCVARLAWPQLDALIVPIPALHLAAVQLAGVGLMLAGTWYVLFAHSYMGDLWMSGEPMKADRLARPDALLQSGPFSRTRNPIFLGVQAVQLGFFFALPSVVTLICLGVGVAVLHRQVRVEEAALDERFGISYRAYAARVPRWL